MVSLPWGIGAEFALGAVLLLWLRRTEDRAIGFGPRGSVVVLVAAMLLTAIAVIVLLFSPARSEALFWFVAVPLGILMACVLYLVFAAFFAARTGSDVVAAVLLIAAIVGMSVVDWQIFRLQ
ncbi:MAG: hypothetical protein ABW224_12335 [Kibdelosporangium sp.]